MCLDSFGVKYIPKKIEKFIGKKNVTANIYKIQAYDSIINGYFCIEFIGFMLNNKRVAGFINSFSPKNFLKWWNNAWVFSIIHKWKKSIVLSAISIENSKILKCHICSMKH